MLDANSELLEKLFNDLRLLRESFRGIDEAVCECLLLFALGHLYLVSPPQAFYTCAG